MTEPARFTYRRRIEFVDTDVSGIVHFSRFLVFMETAEHELLRSLGTSVHLESGGDTIGWPRVNATCDYLAPLRFGDEVAVEVRIARQGTKSMTYAFRFLRDCERVAEGRMTSVCCRLTEAGPEPIPIPDFFLEKLAGAAARP